MDLLSSILFKIFSVKYNRLYFPHAGVDVTANQDEISDHETFQLEFDPTTKRWFIRTMQDKYFTLGAGGGIQANETKRQGIKNS